MDRRIDGKRDGWMEEWIEGWMDEKILKERMEGLNEVKAEKLFRENKQRMK